MKNFVLICAVLAMMTSLALASDEGKELYQKKCAMCHPNGGNIIKAEKTLQKAGLEAAGIATEEGIVDKMRNPGPGMPKFDEKAVPAAAAKAIAEYILTTFK